MQCLLVQGYWSKSNWGFPKGKVNEDEGPAVCAIREVRSHFEWCVNDHQFRPNLCMIFFGSSCFLISYLPFFSILYPRLFEYLWILQVYEETGFDISTYLTPENFLEFKLNEQISRLYIIPGVSMDTQFAPRTRKEIRVGQQKLFTFNQEIFLQNVLVSIYSHPI